MWAVQLKRPFGKSNVVGMIYLCIWHWSGAFEIEVHVHAFALETWVRRIAYRLECSNVLLMWSNIQAGITSVLHMVRSFTFGYGTTLSASLRFVILMWYDIQHGATFSFTLFRLASSIYTTTRLNCTLVSSSLYSPSLCRTSTIYAVHHCLAGCVPHEPSSLNIRRKLLKRRCTLHPGKTTDYNPHRT